MRPRRSISSSRPPQVVSVMMTCFSFMLPTVWKVWGTWSMSPRNFPLSQSYTLSSEPGFQSAAG